MSSEDPESEPDEAYCIECGTGIASNVRFCPECGADQSPAPDARDQTMTEGGAEPASSATTTVRRTDGAGFTSWAIGFEPGATTRNAVVGLAHVLFWPFGLALLVVGYVSRDRETGSGDGLGTAGRLASWGLGALLVLAGLGGLTDPASRATGGVFLAVGVFLLPPVRSAFEARTGFRFARWMVVGVVLVGFVTAGTLAPDTETDGVGTTDASASQPMEYSTTTAEPEPEFAVRITYTGSWQGAVGVTGGGSSETRSIQGTGTRVFEITGDVDIVSVNAQKQDSSAGRLTVQILHDGEVVAESSTTAEYGVAQTSESFY